MNSITSRVHYGDLFTLEAIKQFYDNHPDIQRYIMCREEGIKGDRDHVHIYMETLLTRKQISDAFSYKFKQLKGNRCKSFKLADEGDGSRKHAKQYTCKGLYGASSKAPPDIRGSSEYTHEKILEYHERYWKDRESYEKEKKIRRKGLIGDIIKHKSIKDTDTEREMISKTIDYYLDKDRIIPGKYRLGEIVTTIRLKVTTGKTQDRLKNDLIEHVQIHM